MERHREKDRHRQRVNVAIKLAAGIMAERKNNRLKWIKWEHV